MGTVSFYYGVTGSVEEARFGIYTLSFRKVYEETSLPTGPGVHPFLFDWKKAGFVPANGLYYLVVTFRSAGQESRKVMKLIVRR